MRQRLFILVTVALVLGVLIVLNAANYVEIEREPDTEWNPDRSTYNAGATGTRALYDFLSESGYQVMRWRESPLSLTKSGTTKPSTLIVVGALQQPFTEEERKAVLDWVKTGGRLVLIDRSPDWRFLPAAGQVQVSTEYKQFPTRDAHPDNPDEMTAGVALAQPAQPTRLTRNVETVLPSRFASHIRFLSSAKPTPKASASPDADAESEDYEEPSDEETPVARQSGAPPAPVFGTLPPPPPKPTPPPEPKSDAPVIHLADYQGPLLVDYVHGQGRIVFLSDPFVVVNGGLRRADNLLLARNLAASEGGLIAFDEYHQGHSTQQNQLIAYFSGTPIVPLLAQGSLVVALLVWARGRRFGRPLPLSRIDRRSKLEFVASMAELQQRSRAYDLALENLYTRTRRALVRYAGLGNDAARATIAANVAARSMLSADELETLMRECEEHINGDPLSARRALELAAQLRAIEAALGLQNRTHESRR